MNETSENVNASLTVELVAVASLREDPDNARKHGKKNMEAILGSLREFGQRKPIVARPSDRVVLAGNGTLRAAIELGWEEIYVAWAELDDEQARAYALADNHTGDLSEWDLGVLARHLEHLKVSTTFDVGALGFDPLVKAVSDEEKKNAYTGAVNVPQYEVVGERPDLAELRDDSKTLALQAEVIAAGDAVPDDVKEFLLSAAHRHTVFNYRKIAEYYPHAPAEVQRLMEQSVLVIIDLNDAMRLGYCRFEEAIMASEDAPPVDGAPEEDKVPF